MSTKIIDGNLVSITGSEKIPISGASTPVTTPNNLRNYNGVFKLHKYNGDASYTGSTTPQKLYSVSIPVGSVLANDILLIEAIFKKTGTAGGPSIGFNFNTADSLTGIIPAAWAIFSATQLYFSLQRRYNIKSLSQTLAFPASVSSISDIAQSTTAMSSLAVDFSVQQYFIISLQLGSAADTVTLDSLIIKIVR